MRATDDRSSASAAASSSSSSLPPSWSAWLARTNTALRRDDVSRALRPVDASDSPQTYSARERTLARWLGDDDDLGESADAHDVASAVRVFSGNDYLGLGAHERVRRAAATAAERYGCGPRSSALVCGYTSAHRALEVALAALSETEECVLFPTGYAANSTTLPALCDGEDACIFSDALNHASIVDGCRLAKQNGARVYTFGHGDYDDLERLLAKTRRGTRCVVVSDSLFSMDGDYADVERLAALKAKYGFLLVLDEAHATLVCGARGGGLAQARGKCADVDVHVGTLSKAIGAHGGFVACSREMKRFLVSRARGQMFSTALPAPVVAAALESLRVFADEPERRAKLWSNIDRFNAALATSPSVRMAPLTSPIGSLIIGESRDALAVSAALLRLGFHVPAIRPPTVPRGASRLRVALSAAHTDADIDALAQAIIHTVTTAIQPSPGAMNFLASKL